MGSQVVRQSFNRAADSYDAAARLQRRVCDLLATGLPARSPTALLDAGCGTGYGLDLLAARWSTAQCVAADFAPAMLKMTGGGICADIEALPFAADAFDLYWSSLTWQWCNAGRAMSEAARVLAPGGTLAISSLAPGTLAELDAAFAGADDHRHVLEFSPPEALRIAAAAAGFEDLHIEQRALCLYHPDMATLLRELQALGANQVGGRRRPGLMGRHAWRRIEERYEVHRTDEGLPATFEVILCYATKPT